MRRASVREYAVSRIYIIYTRLDSYKMTSKLTKGIAYEFIFFVWLNYFEKEWITLKKNELLWKGMNYFEKEWITLKRNELLWKGMNLKPHHAFYTGNHNRTR